MPLALGDRKKKKKIRNKSINNKIIFPITILSHPPIPLLSLTPKSQIPLFFILFFLLLLPYQMKRRMAFSSHFTLVFFLLISLLPSSLFALNVTSILSAYPDLSDFTHLLSSTIPSDLSGRSSLTVLAVPNHVLRLDLARLPSSASLPDVLRFHVLLQYLSWPDLRHLPPSGDLVTTLFQTTGRALNSNGAVNLTLSPNGAVTVRSPASNATILSQIATVPYNLSILTVDSLIIPPNLDLTASENRPPLGLNITRVLIDARTFNVAASMLAASGVAEEFEADERGAGITVFVPTDGAFAELPATERLQSLPAERKAVVLKYHVLHSYYPLGLLQSIVNPVQPTLATEDTGAGLFTLNITRVNGTVAIDTGIVQASITQTVFDQNPVSIFAVSRVLLPKDVFGKEGVVGKGGGGGGAPAPEMVAAPQNSVAGLEVPPTQVVAPPGFREEIRSIGGDGLVRSRRGAGLICCCSIGLLYLIV